MGVIIDDTLYEAKLIIIGEAGAGKTTLVKKLQYPAYPINPAEPSTEGIDVAEWHFDLDLSGFSNLTDTTLSEQVTNTIFAP